MMISEKDLKEVFGESISEDKYTNVDGNMKDRNKTIRLKTIWY